MFKDLRGCIPSPSLIISTTSSHTCLPPFTLLLPPQCRFLIRVGAIVVVQSRIRTFLARTAYLKAARGFTLLQARQRQIIAKDHYISAQSLASHSQRCVRGFLARMTFAGVIKSAITVQSIYRAHAARCAYRDFVGAVVTLQSLVRRRTAFRSYQSTLSSIVLVQRYQRRRSAAIKCHSATLIQSLWRKSRQRSEYLKTLNSVVVVQAAARRFVAYRNYQLYHKAVRNRCATMIQSIYRQNLQQRKFQSTVTKIVSCQAVARRFIVHRSFQESRRAAVTIETAARRMLARRYYIKTRASIILFQRHVRSRKAWRQFHAMMTMAVAIQAQCRRRAAQRRYEAKRCAAVMLQTSWRQYHAEVCFIDMRLSALTIQCAFRRYFQERRFAEAVQSITCLQRSVRMWRARQNLQSSIKAAVSIQSSWRRYSDQKRYNKERDASICIQKYYRRHVTENAYLDKLTAIIIQQSWWRRYSAQIKYRQYLSESNASQEVAATMIQTVYRRISAQRKYKKLRELAPAYSIRARIRQINHIGLEDALSPEKSGRRLSHRTSFDGRDGRASETGTPERNTRPLYRSHHSLSPAPPVSSEGESKSASSPLPTHQRHNLSTDVSPLPKFKRRSGLNKDKSNSDGSSLRSKLYASRSSAPNSRTTHALEPGKEQPMPKVTALPPPPPPGAAAAAAAAAAKEPVEFECASSTSSFESMAPYTSRRPGECSARSRPMSSLGSSANTAACDKKSADDRPAGEEKKVELKPNRFKQEMPTSQASLDTRTPTPPPVKSRVANLAQTFGTSVRARKMSFEIPQQAATPLSRSPKRKMHNTSQFGRGVAATSSSPSSVPTPKKTLTSQSVLEEAGGLQISPRRDQQSNSSAPSPDGSSENARSFVTKKPVPTSSRISSLASAFESKARAKGNSEGSVCKPMVMNGRSSLASTRSHLPSKVAKGSGRLSPPPMMHSSRSPRRMRPVYQRPLSGENNSGAGAPPPPSLLKASQHGRLSPPPPSAQPHTRSSIQHNKEGSPNMARKIGMFHQATISQPSPASTVSNFQSDTHSNPASLFQASRNTTTSMNSHRRRREERSGRPSYQ